MGFNIIIAIVMIGFLVIAHEFGHFIVAKANGVCVVEFCVGFGPKLFGIKRGETEYTLRIIPFGGACIMLGDAMMELGDDEIKYDPERSMTSKSVWARIAIVSAGPFFNFIIAFIFAVIIIAAAGSDPCTVDKVEEGTPAYEAGLEVGDRIVKINNNHISFAREYSFYKYYHETDTMNITYERDGEKYETVVTPEKKTTYKFMVGLMISNYTKISSVVEGSPAEEAGLKSGDEILLVGGEAVGEEYTVSDAVNKAGGTSVEICVNRGGEEMSFTLTPKLSESVSYVTGFSCYGNLVKQEPAATIGSAFMEVEYWIEVVLKSVGMMFTGQVGVQDLSGPVGIVESVNTVVSESKPLGIGAVVINLCSFVVMLSANLGVMNLLPVPALDGGKLIFLILEALRGKPVKAEFEGVVNFVGVVLLMMLMVYVMFNDIGRLL